ncbi:MAG: phosphoenolpyruvate synthase [bacterium]|nr:phosphoenolpyruvate synthase [bacterium]
MIWIGEGSADVGAIGGKGANMAQLERIGLPVPAWFAVTTSAFRKALRGSELEERIGRRLARAGATDLLEAAAEIRAWVGEAALPEELAESVRGAVDSKIGPSALCAVRSSALGEDTAEASFAGLHDSFLFVRGTDSILETIRRVWASAFNDRALAYRRERDLPLEGISIAVVVQQMIEASVSGVVFTANPNNGDVHEVVVSALYGAGEGLVSAGLDADTWVVDKDSRSAEAAIAAKTEEIVFDRAAGSGLTRREVDAGRAEASALSEEQLQQVVESSLAIERAFGRPQDIEFSFDPSGALYVLQARAITTVDELGPAAGNRLLWDNSNIIESYSGVTSPMTYSFIRRAYTIVYHCFAEVMGIKSDVVRRNRETFENMLGLFRGQVYYNLRNWYRLIRLFPGFSYNSDFMESMMGVSEGARFGDDALPEPGWRKRYFVELPALLRLVTRSTWNFVRIRRVVGRFQEHFSSHFKAWSDLDFTRMAPHELRALYLEMEEKLLWNWKAPIINDFFVMIFYGTLKKLCATWCADESGSLQNDLICGEGGIESTLPTQRLLELAIEAAAEPELRSFLLDHSPEELAERLPAEPAFTSFFAEIETYLDLYGFRCVNELKLEEFSLKDRPQFLYQMLANYLRMDNLADLDPRTSTERESRIRREAEERAFSALGGFPLGWLRRRLFRRALGNARLGVKNRENMRFARTRIYGLFRELLRALGETLAREELLAERDDIFYLTLDEVWDFIKGTAVTTDLRGLVTLRRAEFDLFRSDSERMPDDRFETFGMAYHRNRFRARRRAGTAASEDGVLRGIGCCPGIVSGEVKLLRSPNEDARLEGEILVAERTDPGWVPLYPAVSGLLIERGSILSHSAIVAREMGIPTIVGIPGLSTALETGQHVTMDGAAGTVELEGGETQAATASDSTP